MNKLLINILLVSLATLPLSLFAEGVPAIHGTVTPAEGTIGSPFAYKVTIVGEDIEELQISPPSERIYYPVKEETSEMEAETADEQMKEEDPADYIPLYIISEAKKDDRSSGSLTDITVILDISFYRPGTYALPAIDVYDNEGNRLDYTIPDVTINEVSEEPKMADIEPPLDLGGNYYRLIILVAGVILLTLASVFGYRFVKKWLEKRRLEKLAIPPLERFRNDIDRFNGKKLIDKEKIDDYVFGVSMIFRRFLSGLLHFEAQEMTSYEIEMALRKVLSSEHHSMFAPEIMKSFDMWDISKYAEFTPTKEMLLENYEKMLLLAEDLDRELTDGTV